MLMEVGQHRPMRVCLYLVCKFARAVKERLCKRQFCCMWPLHIFTEVCTCWDPATPVTGQNICSEGVSVLMEVMVAGGVVENIPWERLLCVQIWPIMECAF